MGRPAGRKRKGTEKRTKLKPRVILLNVVIFFYCLLFLLNCCVLCATSVALLWSFWNQCLPMYTSMSPEEVRCVTFTGNRTLHTQLYSPTKNKSTKLGRWTLAWVTILSSFFSRCPTVFFLVWFLKQPEVVSRGGQTCWDAFRTADSASPRRLIFFFVS